MYYKKEHNPPHFHVRYNEYNAEIDIITLNVLAGKLPAKVLELVAEWAELHQEELTENWNLLQTTGNFNKIQPLV